MLKEFNITGSCVPRMHYMVNISNKIKEIRKLVDGGKYFTINKARQYGKTTIRYELKKVLQGEYIVLNTSFEGLGDTVFSTEEQFTSQPFQIFVERMVIDEQDFAERRILGK